MAVISARRLTVVISDMVAEVPVLEVATLVVRHAPVAMDQETFLVVAFPYQILVVEVVSCSAVGAQVVPRMAVDPEKVVGLLCRVVVVGGLVEEPGISREGEGDHQAV